MGEKERKIVKSEEQTRNNKEEERKRNIEDIKGNAFVIERVELS